MGGPSPSSRDIDRHYRSRDYYGGSSYFGSSSGSSSGRSSYDYHTESVAPKKRITSAEQVFKATRMNDLFNPAKMKLPREALDSAFSPHSRAFIFAEDITGSMGPYLLSLIPCCCEWATVAVFSTMVLWLVRQMVFHRALHSRSFPTRELFTSFRKNPSVPVAYTLSDVPWRRLPNNSF